LPYVVDLSIFLCISTFVYAAGFFIYKKLKLDCSTKLEETVHCCALGTGFWSLLILGAGSLGLLYKSFFYISFLLLAGVLSPFLYKNYSPDTQGEKGLLETRSRTVWEWVLSSVVFMLLILTLINSLAPTIDYDAMVYHYGLPNIYIQEHQIRYLPENIFSGFPQNMEMLFTLGALLRGYEVSNLIQYGVSLLLVLVVFTYSRKYFGRQVALLATAVFCSTPLIAQIFSRPAADMGLALFVCLSFFSLIIWTEHKKNSWLIAAGLYTGLALGTKYSALFFSLALLSCILFGKLLCDRARPREIVYYLSIFLVSAIVVAAPWYIKNLITTGNPFFPAFYNFFGGEDYSAAMALRQLGDAHHRPISFTSINTFLLLPFRLLQDPYYFGNPIGPFCIVFLPYLVLLRKWSPIVKYCLLFTMSYMVLWFLSFQISRFLVPALCVAAILGAFTLEELRQSGKKYLRYMVVLFVGIVLTSNTSIFLNRSRIIFDTFPVVFGAVSKSEYLKKNLSVFSNNRFMDFGMMYNGQNVPDEYEGDIFSVIEYANSRLQPNDKVLFLGETIHCYLRKSYIANSAFNDNLLVSLFEKEFSNKEMVGQLRKRGITHILFNPHELQRLIDQGYAYQLTRSDIMALKNFLFEETVVEFRENDILLLKLSSV
jgi:4-amino-4-deoxy-L-arabinose transferase-like glycosyltransferase